MGTQYLIKNATGDKYRVPGIMITYIGELGWELYIPTEYLHYAYELLLQAGRQFDITNIGYRAIDSLRIEKRYLAWGADITPDYNPCQAGLQFLIDWNKGEFLGSQALTRIRQEGVRPTIRNEQRFCAEFLGPDHYRVNIPLKPTTHTLSLSGLLAGSNINCTSGSSEKFLSS